MDWAIAKATRAEMRGKLVKMEEEKEEGVLEGGPLINDPDEAVTSSIPSIDRLGSGNCSQF